MNIYIWCRIIIVYTNFVAKKYKCVHKVMKIRIPSIGLAECYPSHACQYEWQNGTSCKLSTILQNRLVWLTDFRANATDDLLVVYIFFLFVCLKMGEEVFVSEEELTNNFCCSLSFLLSLALIIWIAVWNLLLINRE